MDLELDYIKSQISSYKRYIRDAKIIVQELKERIDNVQVPIIPEESNLQTNKIT